MLHVFVRRLNLRNFIHMFQTNSARNLVPWFTGALLNSRSLFQEIRYSWRLSDEGERSVRLDGDQSGCWNTRLNVCSPCVKLLAEIHRLDSTSTESWTDRRRGCRLACRDEQSLDKGVSFRQNNISHIECQILLTTI